MKKTGLVSLMAIVLFFAFSFGSVFATNTTMTNDVANTMQNGANGVRNVVGSVENGIENAAAGVTGAVRTGTDNARTATHNTANNVAGATNNNNYTATRTATTGDRGMFGMTTNTLTWVVLAITGIGLVVLLWSFFSQDKTKRSDYE